MHPHGLFDSLDLNDISRMLHICGGEEHGVSQLFIRSVVISSDTLLIGGDFFLCTACPWGRSQRALMITTGKYSCSSREHAGMQSLLHLLSASACQAL